MKQLEEKERAAAEVIRTAYRIFEGRLCLTTSFQKGGIVLLDIMRRVAEVRVPVILIDTRFLFDETLKFAAKVAAKYGVMLIREAGPKPLGGEPWRDPVACCARQKVETFRKAVAPYHAWMTAIRRDQTKKRAGAQELVFTTDGKLRIAPLLSWTAADIDAQTKRHQLPTHPLYSKGYASFGCWPCTTPILEGESDRAGRWRGCDREECGIHD